MGFLRLFKAMLTPVPRLPPSECFDRVRSGEALLIDVREASEWSEGVAKGAHLLAMSDLNGSRTHWKPFLEKAAGKELMLYCAVGGRAGVAGKLLAAEGFKTVNAGGFGEWKAAGWPVVSP
jgi:rhodanese-related sulfurtransferase